MAIVLLPRPYLTFAVAGGRIEFPGWGFKMLLWSLYQSSSAKHMCLFEARIVQPTQEPASCPSNFAPSLSFSSGDLHGASCPIHSAAHLSLHSRHAGHELRRPAGYRLRHTRRTRPARP